MSCECPDTDLRQKQHIDEVCDFLPAWFFLGLDLWRPLLVQLCTPPLDDAGGEAVHHITGPPEALALRGAPVQTVPVVWQVALSLLHQDAQLVDGRDVFTGLSVRNYKNSILVVSDQCPLLS